MTRKVPAPAIRVFTKALDWAGEVRTYESLQFTKELYKAGKFELHIPRQAKSFESLVENNLIMLGGNARKVGVIKCIEFDESRNGDLAKITGPTLNAYAAKRRTIPPAAPLAFGWDRVANSNGETLMKTYIDRHFVNPTNSKRKISLIEVAPDLTRGLFSTPWQTRARSVEEVLMEIGEFTGIGWEFYIDLANRKIIFDAIPIVDQTTLQEDRSPVVFSTEFGNIANLRYKSDTSNKMTTGYAYGAGVDADRSYQIIEPDYEEEDRVETVFDLNNIEDTQELVQKGTQMLSEQQGTKTLKADILPGGPFQYGDHWDIGSKITIRSRKWNMQMHDIVTSVTEVWQRRDGFTLAATFGEKPVGIVDIVKQLSKQRVFR